MLDDNNLCMKCIYCKNEILPSSKFCMSCGRKVTKCSNCDYILPDIAIYCPNCGEKNNL